MKQNKTILTKYDSVLYCIMMNTDIYVPTAWRNSLVIWLYSMSDAVFMEV